MFDFVYDNLKKGLQKIGRNPQLIYTAMVAVLIIGAFIFISERFVGIATDAQERLVNVRIGSLQDAFAAFAGDAIDDTEYLNGKIKEIVSANETIKDFRVVQKQLVYDELSLSTTTGYIVIASDKSEEVGQIDSQADFLYALASGNARNSITVELYDESGRFFKTARAITDKEGDVLAVAMTSQTLSLADMVIEKNIRNSILLLVAILILIVILFLRHSKIIDYVELYKRLKEVDQMKDGFISMASHELRTPLSIIRGYIDFMKGRPEITGEVKDYAEKIDLSAKNLDSLVADILDVSRIEQNRMFYNMERFNPVEIVGETVSSFEMGAKEKNLSITFDKSKVTEKRIFADKERLKQVLVNLVGNSLKYTFSGEIKVSQYDDGKKLFVRVSDTGIGMSSEEREGLFQKFYRVRSTETEKVMGTGLGLWITERIVKDMNGSISVESIKGVGSHFVVSFPLVS